MCGICGLANASPLQPVDEQRLVAMRDSMSYRGPDGAGLHCARGVGLGHRRLSIIDVAGGSQPLANEDGSVWVTFNGEIYNYRALADELRRFGHVFHTRSDTEVLVHGYEQWGDDFVRKLNGMFAFAIHDTRRDRVLLARDHFGIKPLFYGVTGDSLAFASEIKAVVSGLGCDSRPRFEGIQEYLMFRYVAGANTFFEHVQRLPAAHLAVWERGRLEVRPYWTPPTRGVPHSTDRREAAAETGRLLELAVDAQMMSEVPLGTFCSGGVDSGLVTGYASAASPHILQTFAVGFRDPAWDESVLASGTAARYGTAHHTLFSEPEEFFSLFPRLIRFHDEPLNHPNTIPLYQLSRYARRTVTVVLTGEGADEIFCGYPRYGIAHVLEPLHRLPGAGRRAVGTAIGSLPGHRATKLAGLLGRSREDSLLFNAAYVQPELVARLTGAPVDDALRERRRLLAAARVSDDDVDTLSRYEISTYLAMALDRMDRMAMACSLESRVPFLDVPLVEHALQLPTSWKLHLRETKRVLKELAQHRLSPEVTHRSKSGFGVPLGDWFRSPILAPAVARLRDPGHPAAQHFQRPVVDRLLDEHAAKRADHGEALWMLANVYMWYEAVAESSIASPMRDRQYSHA